MGNVGDTSDVFWWMMNFLDGCKRRVWNASANPTITTTTHEDFIVYLIMQMIRCVCCVPFLVLRTKLCLLDRSLDFGMGSICYWTEERGQLRRHASQYSLHYLRFRQSLSSLVSSLPFYKTLNAFEGKPSQSNITSKNHLYSNSSRSRMLSSTPHVRR